VGLIDNFLLSVRRIHETGAATEHSYRPALQGLLDGLADDVRAVNEPKRVKCGAPDFIVQRKEIVVGHVEAKDLTVNIRMFKDGNREQQQRYLKALPNLIYTNCLDWDFFRNGTRYASVTIAEMRGGLRGNQEEVARLEGLLREFVAQRPQTISSTRVLAEMMAGKAALIKDVLFKVLKEDPDFRSDLGGQYRAFREYLLHDITIDDFADIYAETIAYGMFAARLHDETPATFSRQEALDLLPKSNPFLKALFGYVAGPNLDDSIRWIIDDLAAVFQAANVAELMNDFGKLTGRQDPFLHFYEVFLAAYNPAKRKARGVWYTPEPVVNFIVRSVDKVLQDQFGLPDGLADTSKVRIDFDTGQNDKKGRPVTQRRDVHRVQILDPATGTGTFLAEVTKLVAKRIKTSAAGKWSGYIEQDLIPRLHGFELIMASYAMCHMKLDMILSELGYQPRQDPPRLSVYLTNSLEEGEREVRDLFMASWLTREAQQANKVKRDLPIMCVIGNPPYAGESANTGAWATELISPYKREPGGKEKLREKNSKWLNDDYVKFIRYAEHMIERTGEGVVGFITNHGYLNNPTFRGMRWHLLKTFDRLYVLDLHGNSKRKERAPDGSPDKNVFDIQQGVAVLIAVKNKSVRKSELAQLFHGELWGERAEKYKALWDLSIEDEAFSEVVPQAPLYAFSSIDVELEREYKQGFPLDSFMPVNGNGIVTKRDKLNIHFSADGVRQVLRDFQLRSEADVRAIYSLPDDVRDWRYEWAKSDVIENSDAPIVPVLYRPFDVRWMFYSGRARGLVGWPVRQVMGNYVERENIGILAPKANHDASFAHVLVTRNVTEAILLSSTTGSNAMNFPLYLYSEDDVLGRSRQVNFEQKLWTRLKGMARDESGREPDETDTFDYIYGVLHCPSYRSRYGEALKVGYPRILWPDSPDEFWDVAEKGKKLRLLHLLDVETVGETTVAYEGEGDDRVEEVRFDGHNVWINDTQFFSGVAEEGWSHLVGSYKPAFKWLDYRKGRVLSFEEIRHYQRMIRVFSETRSVMETIKFRRFEGLD
jgi:hypothetical protein